MVNAFVWCLNTSVKHLFICKSSTTKAWIKRPSLGSWTCSFKRLWHESILLLLCPSGSWSCHLCLDLLKDKASIYQNAPPSWWLPPLCTHSSLNRPAAVWFLLLYQALAPLTSSKGVFRTRCAKGCFPPRSALTELQIWLLNSTKLRYSPIDVYFRLFST